jgi:hypothetical protein
MPCPILSTRMPWFTNDEFHWININPKSSICIGRWERGWPRIGKICQMRRFLFFPGRTGGTAVLQFCFFFFYCFSLFPTPACRPAAGCMGLYIFLYICVCLRKRMVWHGTIEDEMLVTRRCFVHREMNEAV